MQLGLIGAGNMASALARGIGEPVLVHDLDESKARALAEELGGEAVGSNAELAERADGLVLCHKPKQLSDVAGEVGGQARVVVSILAATTTEQLAEAYPGASIYRFIPNMPTEVKRGVLCYVPGPGAQDDPDAAMRMVVETMGGTADYLARHDYDGPALRARVATPGGTTERGLITLEERGLREVTRAAVDAVVQATR